VTAGSIDLSASAVSMGPATESGAVPHQPLANATLLLAWCAEVAAALQVISNTLAVGGLTVSGGPATFPTAALVATAVAPLAAPPLIMTSALASS
jgi:hypothetical protein